MIKQLTLFCTFAIFMLAVGGAITPLQAHCQTEPGLPHTAPHPHCSEPQIYPVYNVEIDGGWITSGSPDFTPIPKPGGQLPGDGTGWVYDGKSVGSLRPRSDYLDMSYFSSGPSPFDTGVSASQCFFQPPNPLYPLVKFGGFFQKHKKNNAVGMFWFKGKTAPPVVEVLYLLKVEGTFIGDPVNSGFPDGGKVMWMNKWTLKVENQGKQVASRSCEGEGDFAGFTVTFDEQ